MQVAVQDCYRQLNGILQRFGADSSQAVREMVYTTDMDALIKALPDRKTFFADARYPAAAWVQVQRLYDAGHLLEVEWTVRLRQLMSRAGSARAQGEGVKGRAGQEGAGVALYPVLMASAPERREWMAALTAGHVHDAIGLMAGGNHHPLRGAELRALHAWQVVIAGQRLRFHAQPAVGQRGQGA